jgi:uncharacterized protein
MDQSQEIYGGSTIIYSHWNVGDAMPTRSTLRAFHVMAKPVGAICNLACEYCFYLPKEHLYEGSKFRMMDEVQEAFIRQYIEAQEVPHVTVAWQGGEPTLMGLDFFRRSVKLVDIHKRPDMTVEHTIQTNGTTLDDEWCKFLKDNGFLVGLSVDGPKELHDVYRVDPQGRGTHDRVMKGLRHLQEHGVEFNILATIHAANAGHPLDVYRFFRDEVGAQFIQFIPIVERVNETGFQEGNEVSDRSVTAEQFGKFYGAVFDEWVRNDVGNVFVQMFDVTLASWVGRQGAICALAPTCGNGLALEHNGDLYSCDHYVEPGHLLGNIMDTPMAELFDTEKQESFGRAKLDQLPSECGECEVRFACHGGCPKNRLVVDDDGGPELNHLCEGYKAFFNHINKPMVFMANELRHGKDPANIMQALAHIKEKESGSEEP